MEKNKKMQEYLLKNNYVLIFSILTLISILFFMISISKINLGLNLLNQTVNLFSSGIWLLLGLSLGTSSVLAYFEKYKWMVLPVLIWLLIFTFQFRTANIPQLLDITTNEYTLGPDLDPFLYLRLAGEMNQGILPSEDIDCMRYVPLCANNYAYTNLMPGAIFIFYKIISMFSDTTLTYAAILLPVVLFLISIIGFFLFVKEVSSFKINKIKSSIIALIASMLYAVTPSMLHRTTGGIPEIESLGMAFFWFAFLFFTLAWKNKNKNKWIILGIIAGLFTGLMSWTWGGYRYIYMIFSLTAFLIFFFEKENKKNTIIFSSWLITALIIEFLKYKTISALINSIPSSGFALAVFALIILKFAFTKLNLDKKFKNLHISNSLKVIILAIVLGVIALLFVNPRLIWEIPSIIINGLIAPYGNARVSVTVAENRAPYLLEAIQQFGNIIWLFLISALIIFYESIKHFSKKNKIRLTISFVIFLACIVFTRFSSTSIFNGSNFTSNAVFLLGIAIFIITVLNIYIKSYKSERSLEDFKWIDFSHILLISFAFWAIISMRGAIRLFFIVSPMLIILASSLPIKLFEIRKKSKDEMLRFIVLIVLILSVFAFYYSFVQYSSSSTAETKATIPGIYEQQWQKAMAWVRDNTEKGSVFVHWWDYGYWIQSIGERPTVTDGGHFLDYWDHLIGRYVLTTPIPATALSFMKTHDVSYLLIDSTDLGKYSAYSSIGSDSTDQDRYSWMPVMPVVPQQTQETKEGFKKVYAGGFQIDSDVLYKENGTEIFFASQTTGIAGLIVDYSGESIKGAQTVLIQNNVQTAIPVRYVYYFNKLYDLETGIEATIVIIPTFTNINGQINIDHAGSAIYLSNKTMNSLFAQLYLMNDPLNKYPTVKLVHKENDVLIEYLNSQGFNLEFVYYGGFRGPIKIWKIDYPGNILEKEEFLSRSGNYAEFDNLEFTK